LFRAARRLVFTDAWPHNTLIQFPLLESIHFLNGRISGNVLQFLFSYNYRYKFVIKEVIVIISYEPLWKTLEQKNITQYFLIKEYGFSTGTLDALRKNKSITLNTLHDICEMLDCKITDVVEFKKE